MFNYSLRLWHVAWPANLYRTKVPTSQLNYCLKTTITTITKSYKLAQTMYRR